MEDIAPQTIWLGRCFTVGTVYFSAYRDSARLQTWYLLTKNWSTEDSSEKSTLFHISVFQPACLLAKSRCFFFIVLVKRRFLADLHHFSPNSKHNLRWIVLVLTAVPVSINLAWTFLEKLVGERVTTWCIRRSSLLLVTFGLSDLFLVVVAHIYPPVTRQHQTLTCWTIRTLFITRTTLWLEEFAPA